MRPHRSSRKASDTPWYSRGYVPHFDVQSIVQSLTFHLHDAMPVDVVKQWKQELEIEHGMSQSDPRHIELRRRIAVYGDKGYGECWLRRHDVARIVENALMHFNGKRYGLLAWCVMPNHLHAVVEVLTACSLGAIVHSWKSYTAIECNKLLGRSGAFWERDYYDRYVRNEDHLLNVVRYVENNPVAAGLVQTAEDWQFSSANAR